MKPFSLFLLAAVAIIAGTFLLVVQRSEPIAGTLIAGALGVLGREVQVAHKEKRRAREAYEREAETTATLRREITGRAKGDG